MSDSFAFEPQERGGGFVAPESGFTTTAASPVTGEKTCEA